MGRCMIEKVCFILGVGLALAFFAVSSAEAGRALTVGVYQNQPGVFADDQGVVRGFYIDLLEHIAAQAGWTLEYVPGSWSQNLERLKNGKIDLLPAIAFTKQRQ